MLESIILWTEQLDALLSFQRPGWFVLLLPVLLLLVWQRHSDAASQRWRSVINPHLLSALLQQSRREKQKYQLGATSLALLTVLCWVLVLSGPRWQGMDSAESTRRQPLVISLAMDESMLQKDVAPSRLTLARLQLQEVLRQYSGSEVALQVFAGSHHQVLPLTKDGDSLLWYLKHLQPDLMPQSGWQPLSALQAGNALLQRNGIKGKQLLLTGQRAGLAAELADYPSDAASVVVWSLGAESTQLPLSLPGHIRHYPLRGLDPSLPGLNDRFFGDGHTPEQAEGALDLGYYLCWPLLLLTLLWFRRGRLLQWQ